MAHRMSSGSSTRWYRKVIFPVLVVLFCAGFYAVANAQSYLEPFGQNRIQYRKFQWKYFDTKHFRVYHYDRPGRQLGRYVAEEAEDDISLIEHKLGGQFPKRFNIILYNSYDDYRQTNIGLKDESQGIGNSKAGTINLVGDKLVVYFTGEHGDLQHQIQFGMARVVMERMIFGDNFAKMVKNAVILDLPPWVPDGYIGYIVDGWDAASSSKWQNLLADRPDVGFYELANEYPELAGKAFWKFVATQYGPGTVKKLLYAMQKKTKLTNAIKDNLHLKITKAYDSCMSFYKKVYAHDALAEEKPDSTKGLIALKVPKDNSIIRDIRVSPRGSDICYVVWKDGEFTVYDQKTSKEQDVAVLLQGGQKDLTEQIDPSYPMIAWSNTGYKMALLYKKGHSVRLRIYNSLKGRINDYVIPKNRFDQVLSMCFGTDEDEDKLVFSAIKKSQTDLYMFTLKGSKMTNITDDVWDDVSPQFVSGGAKTGIIFLSNRPKPDLNVPQEVNELPTGPMNAFFYNTKTMKTELLQLSNVKKGVISQPIQYGLDNFAYLCDSNGVNNKYVVLFGRDKTNHDSAYAVPITNYYTSILSQQYNLASGDVADVIQVKDKYMVYFHELQMPGVNTKVKKLAPTTLSADNDKAFDVNPEELGSQREPGKKHRNARNNSDADISDPEIKGGNAFQSEFADDTVPQPKHTPKTKINRLNGSNTNADSSVLSVITDSSYLNMKPSPYKLSFKADMFNVKLDNSILFSQYQSIAANGGAFVNPSLSGLITFSLDELMEDYKITGGLELPIDGSPTTYFLQYQNFRRRIDWGILLLRSTDKAYEDVGYIGTGGALLGVSQELFKSITNFAQADFSYPLDRVHSIRFHTALRQDRSVEKVTDTLSLAYNVNAPAVYTSISRLEYVFDNTTSPVLNISNGMKFKVYGEEMYGFGPGNPGCYNFGADIRNYTKLYRNFILANRMAYAHSDGSSEVEYLVGGVDDWISPKQAANESNPPQGNYGFQAMENTLRGYDQYARVGNNFFIFNTELRLPILTTFLSRPIQSSILRNLQFVAFMDMGDAWNGFLPTANNLSNTYNYPQFATGNVYLSLTVPNADGLALGYGAGLRTALLGYFVRMDVARSIESKTVLYFALGTDF